MEIKRKDGLIYAPLKDKWLVETPEENVRQNFICSLVENYGYKLEQMAQEIQVNNSLRGQGKARADIVIWKNELAKKENKSAFIVVECKAENVKIHSEDYFQGYNYASWAGATFFVTTNNKETRYFNVDKDYLPKMLEEILAIPKASDLENENKIRELLSQTKTFTREEFTRLLFRCHNIIRNNDKLSPEAAFDEISKILFMKINFERDKKGTQVFTIQEFKAQEKNYEENIKDELLNEQKNWTYMQFLFSKTKRVYADDKLFEENEVIKIRQNSFESIIEELQKYNLSDTSDDVKGIAFEEFLGKTFRGELGQFFTPRSIVNFMTHVLDPHEDEIICDPTCGSGGFLIKTFEYIREKIENDIQIQKEIIKEKIMTADYDNFDENKQNEINKKINNIFNILNKELENTANEMNSRLSNLSHNNIYGTDANPRMARTSKMNMIMHGDGHGGVHHHDGLLNVNGIFEERFDVILTNPPFGARIDKSLKISDNDKFLDEQAVKKYTNKYGDKYTQALKQVNDNIGNSILSLYDVGTMSNLTEILFMERCLKLLKKGGRMGMVLPEGVLNTSNLQKVREYFEGKAKLLLICSIPQDVFIAAGATVKPSLVFMKRFTEEEEKEYANIKIEAIMTCEKKYSDEIKLLKNELETIQISKKDYVRKKETNKRLLEIDKLIEEESKPIIKEKFNYEITIAKVDKAGITSTGAKCENELDEVLEEFEKYNQQKKLWNIKKDCINYIINENSQVVRISNGKEQILK